MMHRTLGSLLAIVCLLTAVNPGSAQDARVGTEHPIGIHGGDPDGHAGSLEETAADEHFVRKMKLLMPEAEILPLSAVTG